MDRIRTLLLFMGLTILGCLPAYGQHTKMVYGTESEGWAEAMLTTAAQQTGQADLVGAIANGSVNVYAGKPGKDGTLACTFPDPDHPGSTAMVVTYTPDGELAVTGGIHEWTHYKNNHPGVPESPTAAELQGIACNETVADCASLNFLMVRYTETGIKPPCAILHYIMQKSAWEALYCAFGMSAMGPPAESGCAGQTVPPCSG
jgi:hypothetical protein